ncbi:HD domain-containing protein [Litchfieldia alkalitelluris]|uniref:HD domain-containing protein n=1 Tax=Litchfieldia alkalitelluris TaxID=304268 RepID=UPI000996F580|nr:HD domain-containing protein [Litchfieldia alkalitelluris]
MLDKHNLIIQTEQFVYEILKNESSGHDWWHIQRVRKIALIIGEKEQGDLFIIEMAALLHDIADEKLNESEEIGINKVKYWLQHLELDQEISFHILEIIQSMSFKGGNRPPVKTTEGQVVQDADRLDAIGAIGIARTFAYAGSKGDLIYDPELPYRKELTKQEYRNGKSTAINHFYEKLLKLSGTLNTETARKIAKERHVFMERFLEQFYNEWNGQL